MCLVSFAAIVDCVTYENLLQMSLRICPCPADLGQIVIGNNSLYLLNLIGTHVVQPLLLQNV